MSGGDTPDPEELVARHPEFAPELKEYLETRTRVEVLAAPLRWVARAVADSSPYEEDDLASVIATMQETGQRLARPYEGFRRL